MRTWIVLFFCVAAAAQNPPVQTKALCSLEGRVVSEATGAALADVKVRLQPPAPAGANPSTVVSFVTMTDESGRFALVGIEPGSYTLSAERSGYLKSIHGARRSSPAGTPLKLACAETRTGLELRLRAQGVITGRVVDPEGAPASDMFVYVAREAYTNGKRQLTRNFGSLLNDLGEFRVSGLAPGRYYVLAMPFPALQTPQYLSGKPPDPFQTTYHPSTMDLGAAETVEVTAGATVTGVEIRVIRSPAFVVRGRVVNSTGGELSALDVTRAAAGGEPSISFGLRAPWQFVIGAVPRGSCSLVVEGLNSEGRRIATRYTIDVDGPVENLELAINPPVVVQGRVTVEDAPIPKGAKVLLDLQEGLPDISLARNAAVGEDGAFLLPDVNLDRYYVSMAGLPDGFFVKSIRLGKKDVLEDGADLTEKPEYPLEIVLGSNAATIRGSVAGAGAGATVVLAPASAKRRARAEFYRTSLTDQGGKFTFANLAPGDYTLFAWDDVENGAWMDPAFLKQVEAQGRPMKLRDGETAEVEVNAIP